MDQNFNVITKRVLEVAVPVIVFLITEVLVFLCTVIITPQATLGVGFWLGSSLLAGIVDLLWLAASRS
jgi:hypothetical protein